MDKDLCRICYEESGRYDIFDHKISMDNRIVLMAEALSIFSTFQMEENTNNPRTLCNDCTQELGIAYKFFLKVQKSEERYETDVKYPEKVIKVEEDFIENSIDSSDAIPVIKENDEISEIIIDDYVMIDEEQAEMIIESVPKVRKKIKINRIPNIQMTSNVASIIKKVHDGKIRRKNRRYSDFIETKNQDKSPSVSQFLRQKTNIDDAINNQDNLSEEQSIETINCETLYTEIPEYCEEDEETARQKHSLIVPQFVIQQTNNDPLINEENLCAEQTITGEIVYTKSKSPRLHKATLNVTAVNLDNHQVDMYCNLTKKEDQSIMYMCKYCPKAFSSPYHLGLHTKKTHICQYCLSSFSKIADLHKHVRLEHHTFECSMCSRKFTNNSNLRAHMRKNHNVNLPAHVSLITLNNIDQ